MERPRIIVNTGMRVGSTWLCEMLGILQNSHWGYRRPHASVYKIVLPEKPFVLKTHHQPPNLLCEAIESDLVFVVNLGRNLADQLLSRAMYMRYHQGGSPFKRRREGWSDIDFVKDYLFDGRCVTMAQQEKVFQVFQHPKWWRTTYEKLQENAVRELTLLGRYIGAEWPTEIIELAVVRREWSRVTKREKGQEIKRNFRRKGIVGDAQNLFTSDMWERIRELEAMPLVEESICFPHYN